MSAGRCLVAIVLLWSSARFIDESVVHVGKPPLSQAFGIVHAVGVGRPKDDASNDGARKTFLRLAEIRKGRMHWPVLDGLFEDDENALLDAAEHILAAGRAQDHFDDDEESLRMMAIDYLGEKIRGRLASTQLLRIEAMALAHLEHDVFDRSRDTRQQQSLVGDKMDIMQAFAHSNPQRALSMLSRYEHRREYTHLRTAIINGLYLRGHSESDIKAQLESAAIARGHDQAPAP